MKELLDLTARDLQEIANALRSGRLLPPFSPVSLHRVITSAPPAAVADQLRRLSEANFNAEQIALTLDLLRADRARRPTVHEVVQVVTTGPETDGNDSRDTSVVVRDLFASATRSVLVAGYVVYQGQRVFQTLADQMQIHPSLNVTFFLDVQRPQGDSSSSAELVRRFSDRFIQTQWPAERPVPIVYYDPRSLDLNLAERSSLHAKCVVVDENDVFVSSANFTEAAQRRNIELGLLLRSSSTADAITQFFQSRLRANQFVRLF